MGKRKWRRVNLADLKTELKAEGVFKRLKQTGQGAENLDDDQTRGQTSQNEAVGGP